MSDMRTCATCGLTFETGLGSDQQYCTYCDEATTYAPSGVSDVEPGDPVSHLHFTGVVTAIRGKTLDGTPSTVEVRVEKSSWTNGQGYVTIGTDFLDAA